MTRSSLVLTMILFVSACGSRSQPATTQGHPDEDEMTRALRSRFFQASRPEAADVLGRWKCSLHNAFREGKANYQWELNLEQHLDFDHIFYDSSNGEYYVFQNDELEKTSGRDVIRKLNDYLYVESRVSQRGRTKDEYASAISDRSQLAYAYSSCRKLDE